jgi:N-formylglutamate deformylase
VDYNHPYKGVELVRRYGKPAEHTAIRSRSTASSMNEQTLELNRPATCA